MNKLDEIVQEFDDAWNDFWATHDRLVSEGIWKLEDLRVHPDYIAADTRCLDASAALHDARQEQESEQ